MQEWVIAYLLTCLVEIPIIVALVHAVGWRPRRAPRAFLLAWLLQFTHPLLWLAHPQGVTALIAAETLVVAVEGFLLAWWATTRAKAAPVSATLIRALLIAFVANASSMLIGLLFVVLRLTAW